MRLYRFGPFVVDAQERRLLRDGEPISLTPKVFDTLVYLLERQGHLVGKDELMEAIWGGSYVEEGNLPRTIHILRRTLGNGDNDPKYIETVPTKGYRFEAVVECADEKPAMAEPPIRTARAEPEATSKPNAAIRRALAVAGGVIVMALATTFAVTHWRALNSNGAPTNRTQKTQTANGAAYIKYETGRLHMVRHYRGDYAAALENFDEATRLDPQFAAAYAGKADAKVFLYFDSGSHDDIAQARAAITKAIELDPNSSYAHALLCRIRATYDWDFAGAEPECRRAVQLGPENNEAVRELAFLLNSTGRKEDALREMDAAIALAPTSYNKRSRGLLLYFARRFDEAIAQFKQVEATDPEYAESSRWMARCFEQKRDYAQALEFLIRFRESDGAGSEESATLRRAFAAGGWPEVLRASLPRGQAKPNMETAGTFAQLGEKDKAFEVLEAMITNRRVMIVQMDSEPRLDPLRSDPRFEQFAKRAGLRSFTNR
jgi:DNA-binding winged helix-turn-helix (wHTH) protein/Tfp pilus assembly protein PilF